MAQSRNADREARERFRRYSAGKSVHAHQLARRRRDNIIAAASVLLVVALASFTQFFYFSAGPGASAPSASGSPDATPDAQPAGLPSPELAEGRTWTGGLVLNEVDLGIRIDGDLAPQAASVFISLVQDGYYTGNSCHRLTSGEGLKVIQCGQPDGVTSIDPGYQFGPIENAPADGIYPAGTIAMARAQDPDSQSTQFFITYEESVLPTDGGGYTVFGAVTSGLDTFVTDIASGGVAPGGSSPTDGAPAIPTTITAVTVQ